MSIACSEWGMPIASGVLASVHYSSFRAAEHQGVAAMAALDSSAVFEEPAQARDRFVRLFLCPFGAPVLCHSL